MSAEKKIRGLNFFILNSLGLHLNLTEGRPIGSTYDSLLDSNGEFLDKGTFRQAALEGRIDFREVRHCQPLSP